MTDNEDSMVGFIPVELLDVLIINYPVYAHFFDPFNPNNIEKKLEYLTLIKNGKKVAEIPDFIDILDDYPPKDVLWDVR